MPSSRRKSLICELNVKGNDYFVVSDAGGGIVNLITYEALEGDFMTVREAIEGNGGLCGAVLDHESQQLFGHFSSHAMLRRPTPHNVANILNDGWGNDIKAQFCNDDRSCSIPNALWRTLGEHRSRVNDRAIHGRCNPRRGLVTHEYFFVGWQFFSTSTSPLHVAIIPNEDATMQPDRLITLLRQLANETNDLSVRRSSHGALMVQLELPILDNTQEETIASISSIADTNPPTPLRSNKRPIAESVTSSDEEDSHPSHPWRKVRRTTSNLHPDLGESSDDAARSKCDTPQPARRLGLTITNLDPDRTKEASDGIPPDETLVDLYQQLSNKALNSLLPSVWTSNGRFTAKYKHLQNTMKPTKDRTIPNKDGLQWCSLFGKVFQCHPVSTPTGWKRIVLSVARSSNVSPTYGRPGMVQRATVAAEAWIKLQPNEPALTIVHTRTRVSSCEDLGTKTAYVQEILRLLTAANRRSGTRVEILSVSIDGFTTNTPSIAWLKEEYPNVDLRLIYVVPSQFPESYEDFPTHSNGIRYGQYSVSDIGTVVNDIAAVVGSYENRDLQSPRRLVSLLNRITAGKSGQQGGTEYKKWTGDRGGFRVNPESAQASGVDPELPVLSRQLR